MSKSKPVNLTQHKNTLYKHKRREKRRELMQSIKSATSMDIRAYALVSFDSEGKAYCYWDTGSIMPMWSFASTVKTVLEGDVANSDAEETWKPKPDQF